MSALEIPSLTDGYRSKRHRLEIQRARLDSERQTFMPQWRDNADYILPRRPRFFVSDVNKGDRRNQKIIDSTGTLAVRTLRAGMTSGITSPARPWFRLGTLDPQMDEFGPVKDWLYQTTNILLSFFGRSNLYNVLPICYGDLGVFGQGPLLFEEDVETLLRGYSFPIGSYMISNNHLGKVDVFYREFQMSVRQLVTKFGTKTRSGSADWSNFSGAVKSAYDRGDYELWVSVVQAINPNPDYDRSKMSSRFKKYESCYYERGFTGTILPVDYYNSAEGDRYLSESGYDYFPVLCPRWEVTGEDAYATDCPGMTAIGDIKQLQVGEKRAAQAIDKIVNPPMIGPSTLRNEKASILPGDITYIDERDGVKGFRPAHEVNPRVLELENKQQQVRERVKRAFYEDLFLQLSESDRREITAREIEERHEEKLLALGPVLEQLNQDLLDPLIDIGFEFLRRQKKLPPPPPELHGMPLQVEYISIMAQAQKAIGISSIERFAGFVGQIAQTTGDPSVLDNVDVSGLIEKYGDMLSIPPGIIRSKDEVQQIKAQRAQQQQQQMQAERLQQAAGAAKDLAGADTSGDNALTQLLEQAKAGSPIASPGVA